MPTPDLNARVDALTHALSLISRLHRAIDKHPGDTINVHFTDADAKRCADAFVAVQDTLNIEEAKSRAIMANAMRGVSR